jgi:deazaflavin-dependent oxidoreductase (nitroreductase family)
MNVVEQTQRVGLRVHQFLYERSGGRFGHRIGPLTALLLHTTGRRTGLSRTSALVYRQDGDDYVVVASNGGSEQAPGWYHNLRAHPEAEIQIGTERFPVVAHDAVGDEYDRYWKLVNERNRNRNGGRYEQYQARTSRRIPVVVLTASKR